MFRRWLSKHGRWLCLGLGALAGPALLAGCDPACRGVRHAGSGSLMARHVEPAPPEAGTYLHAWADAQAFKGEADKYVIYSYEWYKGGATLGPWGSTHLRRIVTHIQETPFNVLIEECPGEEALNQQRRALVVAALRSAGVPNAERRVVIGFSDAGHLYGDEIEPIYQGYISRNNNNYGGLGLGGFGLGGVPGYGTAPFVPVTGGFGTFGGFRGPFIR